MALSNYVYLYVQEIGGYIRLYDIVSMHDCIHVYQLDRKVGKST